MEQIYDTVIIGSGPGGLTAAIYNARAELKTVVISGNIPGGQLTVTTTVCNWPGFPNNIGGVKLMMDMQQQVKNLGVEIKNGIIKKILKSKDLNSKLFELEMNNGEVLKARAVIVATGAGAKWLELPKEVRMIGRGISGCATCDGMFFRDKTVAVVGGGNVACQDVSFLSKICKKIYLIHRRDELRATPVEANKVLENEKIEKIWNSVVEEIIGETKLEAIKIKNVKSGEEKILPVDGMFVAIGRIPATTFVKDLVELTNSKYIVVGKNGDYPSMTTAEGVFAAGDCMDERHRQAIVAAGAGARAAMDAERWLDNQ